MACLPVTLGAQDAYVPNEIIVCFRETVPASRLNQLPSRVQDALDLAGAQSMKLLYPPEFHRTLQRMALDLTDLDASTSLSALQAQERTVIVTLKPGQSVQDALEKIKDHPAVQFAEPNYYLRRLRTPNESASGEYGVQWGLHNTAQAGTGGLYDPAVGVAGRDIDAELAWDTVTGSTSAVVAVIDSGVAYAHADLAANIWTNTGETVNGIDDDLNGLIDDVRGWDFGDNDNDPNDNCGADPGHGTHVAGIIGAVGNNSVGVVGVGWNVPLMALKVEDSSDCDAIAQSDVAQAIAYAVGEGARVINMSLGGESQSSTLQNAITAAHVANVVVVAAAGNDGDTRLIYPAAYSGVVGVVATDRLDQKPSFSNYGTWVTLCAPGTAIRSTYPSPLYAYLSGTSMATPMTAGVAALVISQYPALTRSQVISRMTSSCENIDALNPGLSGQLGAGRINAARALLSLSAVSPAGGTNDTTATLTLTGVSFIPGMTVQLTKTGVSTITATNIAINGARTFLTCQADLTGAATGQWNVVAATGSMAQTLANAFTIEAFSLTSISPTRAANTNAALQLILTGRKLASNMTVRLQLAGQSDIAGTAFNALSESSATANFDLRGASGGRWNVVLTQANISSTLSRALIITSPSFDVVMATAGQANTFTLTPPQGTQTLIWPAGAASQNVELDLDATPSLPAVDANRDPYVATGIGLDITPSISNLTFATPLSLTVSYRLADLSGTLPESALTLATYNTTTTRWEPLASTVDKTARTVTASVSHLSLFALLQHAPSSALNRVVAFPNPFRANLGHTRVVFDFLTAGSRLRLYDVAGSLVHDMNDDDNDGQIIWLMNNQSGQPVASGVYIYLITDGNGNRKVDRLGVVR